MGQDRDRNSPPVDIYGPEGLRLWLRTAIRYSVSRIVPPYRVHELMDIPMAPEWRQSDHNKGRYFYDRKRKNGTWGTHGLAGKFQNSKSFKNQYENTEILSWLKLKDKIP